MGHLLDEVSLVRNLDSSQKLQLQKICDTSKLYLNRIAVLFPNYTDHSFDHPARALKILDAWLLDDEQKMYLTARPWTAFFLVCGVYLHDIGMADLPGLPAPPKTEEKATWTRQTHHERTYKFIVANWQDLGFSDEFQAEIAALICLAHRKIEFSDPRIARRIPYGHAGELVDIRFAAGAVKLADELDLTFERTPFQVREMLSSLDADSDIEWAKHLAIGGVGPHDELPGTIRVWCRSKSPTVHRALKRHEAKLQGVLDDINRYISPRFPFFRINYDVEKIGYVAEDMRFEMTFATGLRLVTSINLYGEPRVFLRELIQNAIDACLLRAELEKSFSPQVCVQLSPNLDWVTVEDNGIGMNLNSIRKYLVPVGVSFYQSSDFLALGAGQTFGFSPISAFGIGLLSCFIVAERIVISTKTASDSAITLTIADPLGYFEIEEGRRSHQGTQVQVFFRTKPPGLWRYAWDTIYCSSIPITWIDKDECRDDVYQRPVSVREELRTERWWQNNWKNIKEEQIEFEESEGFAYTWLLPTAIPKAHSGATTVKVLQEGIAVAEESEIVPGWASKFIWGRINLRGAERLGLTLSRNQVVRDERLKHVAKKFERGCLRLFESILSLQEQLPEAERTDAVDATLAALTKPLSFDYLLPILCKHMYFYVMDSSGELRRARLSDLAKSGVRKLLLLERTRDFKMPIESSIKIEPGIGERLKDQLSIATDRESKRLARILSTFDESPSTESAALIASKIADSPLCINLQFDLPLEDDTVMIVRRYQVRVLEKRFHGVDVIVDSLRLGWVFCPDPLIFEASWQNAAPWESP